MAVPGGKGEVAVLDLGAVLREAREVLTTVLTVLITMAILAWLFHGVAKSRAVEGPGTLVFGAAPAIRWTMLVCGVVLVGMGATVAILVEERAEGLGMGAAFAALGVASVFAIPPEIVVSEEGLTSRRWWGAAKSMRWPEVQDAPAVSAQQPMRVVARDGTRIVHTVFNVDRARFAAEVERRRGGGGN